MDRGPWTTIGAAKRGSGGRDAATHLDPGALRRRLDCYSRLERRDPGGPGATCPSDNAILATGARRSVLHHLPQPATPHRRTRARYTRRRAPERQSGSLGARDRQAARAARCRRRGGRGPMPPPIDAIATSLEREIDRAWAAHPNPGRIGAVHRLNRTEYNNAIRDLFALDLDVKSAAARRRNRRRQLRQLRRRAVDFDRASRALSVGRAAGHAARDRPAADEPAHRDVRDSAARRAGRPAERGPAVRIARRHRDSLQLPRRRRVPRSRFGCSGSIRTTSRAWAGRSSSTSASTASC